LKSATYQYENTKQSEINMTKTIIVFAFLMIPAIVAGQAKAEVTATEIHMPSFSELEEGWNTMKPGGETSCAHGTEFEFYTRAGDPGKLLVYLYGGGACFDAERCREGTEIYPYRAKIGSDQHPSRQGGILEPDNPENPFEDYSMVAIPVCTGDVHIGNIDTTYKLESEEGEQNEFTIHHRGLTNTLSAIHWATSNFESPKQIVVAGVSAGSLGIPFHSSFLARHYPDVPVAGIGDDASSFSAGEAAATAQSYWGLPEVLQQYPGWEMYGDFTGVENLYITGGKSASNLNLYQIDHANDYLQYFWLERTVTPNPDVLANILENQNRIRSALPGFRSYISGGYDHVSLVSSIRFYRYQVNGHRLRDWVAAIVNGEDVPDVVCEECSRPDFIFDKDDLTIINALISRLSEPDSWNPNDEEGVCPENAENWTLRCAISDVVREMMGQSAANYPVAHDIINEAVVRTGYDRGRGSTFPALRLYNNAPGRTHGEIIEFLETVRERIRLQLDSESDNGEE
jgi:hypothetical protein